jgi:lipopolysaccharide/colanic/teichoic acid biosynthesis glycosyltransferase
MEAVSRHFENAEAKASVTPRRSPLKRKPHHLSVIANRDGAANLQAALDATRRVQPLLGRPFDVTVALVAILVFLPLLILMALAIKVSAPGPVLFVQQRVGRDGRLFPCLKFRTMVVNAQDALHELLATCPEAQAEWDRDQKLRRDPRITQIGTILRKSSLDELPQLFNIVMGHMSIVGPRPIIEGEIERYGSRFGAYCSVRPGLTGLWQVSGRNEVSYEARVRLDAFYARRKSTLYDLGICLRTVPAVIGSRGVY